MNPEQRLGATREKCRSCGSATVTNWKSKADLSYDPFFPDAKDKFLEAYDQGSDNWNMKINHVEYKFEVLKSERGWIK